MIIRLSTGFTKEFWEMLDACRGEQGEELQWNAEEVKRKSEKAREYDGEATRELNAFLEQYVWLVGIGMLQSSFLLLYLVIGCYRLAPSNLPR